jgi:hypothetical protein
VAAASAAAIAMRVICQPAMPPVAAAWRWAGAAACGCGGVGWTGPSNRETTPDGGATAGWAPAGAGDPGPPRVWNRLGQRECCGRAGAQGQQGAGQPGQQAGETVGVHVDAVHDDLLLSMRIGRGCWAGG